jgi:hypothetical protein
MPELKTYYNLHNGKVKPRKSVVSNRYTKSNKELGALKRKRLNPVKAL